MRLLSTWLDYLASGRIRADLGQGIILDTETLTPKDTGWRNLALATGVTGTALGRRSGVVVQMAFYNIKTPATGHQPLLAVPQGFEPQNLGSGANWRHGPLSDDAGTSVRQTSFFSGNMRLLSAGSVAYGGTITYLTNQAWPLDLPGTPA